MKAPKWFSEFVEKQFKPFVIETRSDIAGIKADVSDLKTRMINVESEVAGIKTEIVGIKSNITTIFEILKRNNLN